MVSSIRRTVNRFPCAFLSGLDCSFPYFVYIYMYSQLTAVYGKIDTHNRTTQNLLTLKSWVRVYLDIDFLQSRPVWNARVSALSKPPVHVKSQCSSTANFNREIKVYPNTRTCHQDVNTAPALTDSIVAKGRSKRFHEVDSFHPRLQRQVLSIHICPKCIMNDCWLSEISIHPETKRKNERHPAMKK